MAVDKRSISMDSDLTRRVEAAARIGGVSFSAWLAAAAERELRFHEGLQAIREYEEEYGAFTDEERAEAKTTVDRLMKEAREVWEADQQ